MSERSRARERSEYCGTSKQVSGASERANGRASDPVLQSGFLVILAHSVLAVPRLTRFKADMSHSMLDTSHSEADASHSEADASHSEAINEF